ncbi:MAG: substrate-binding domain-containing protein, partial [Natronomonas sp.]|uniref:ABC transporter substrate-binding protein n=1 Tax=Natronomonas sp. TaxID=2184060 RepID=UPI0028703557
MTEDSKPKSTNVSGTQNRRQFLRYTGGAAAVTTALAGCLGNGDDGDDGGDGGGDDGEELADEISFMTWGGSFLESIESNYAQAFEEEYGVTVNVIGASSGHEMLARIRAGAEDVHIINPEEVPGYGPIQEGLIHPIRKENISNYDKIRDRWNPDEAVYDPGEEIHHIPHVYGGTGLVYNHDELDEPSSWMDIMTEDLKGRQVYFNYPNYVVGQAAIALDMDIAEAVEDESMMEDIWELVEQRNEYVYQWSDSGSTTMEVFSSGSALAGGLWVGRTAAIQDDGVPVTYTVPEEGAYAWLNTLNIPSYVEDPH